jgi:hypothetical protein
MHTNIRWLASLYCLCGEESRTSLVGIEIWSSSTKYTYRAVTRLVYPRRGLIQYGCKLNGLYWMMGFEP